MTSCRPQTLKTYVGWEASSQTDNGHTYQPNVTHSEMTVKELGLQGAKKHCAHQCQSFTTRVRNFWTIKGSRSSRVCALERTFGAQTELTCNFGANECWSSMSTPTVRDWSKLKRMYRFLAGCPRLVYEYKFQDAHKMPTACSDANWARNASDRRSASGVGVLMRELEQDAIAHWLSSAKSELCAWVKASAEALGSQPVARDLGHSWSTVVHSDASAALGVIQREGLERRRHVDCKFLFVESLNACKVVQYAKVSECSRDSVIFKAACAPTFLEGSTVKEANRTRWAAEFQVFKRVRTANETNCEHSDCCRTASTSSRCSLSSGSFSS